MKRRAPHAAHWFPLGWVLVATAFAWGLVAWWLA